ncbi:hypothetical protein NCAS_0B05760 [Naumovozyma castellii]|uniref:Integrase catalytic domain-containing protein n=1 Tax=Naumovozyma castellii TaxID=27288 RepID=G0V9P3_NAUCA|nr:hypothetical protein NCAS_0B05760 [Naumovozyma castellii CBS 4309]CCC68660.1 hypothetical protein NCAS_0B05760 [Naumovozyma castellii CBS 4309]
MVAAHYFWPKLLDDVKGYIKRCETCQKSKNSHGLLVTMFHPLQVPSRRFEALSLDFVSGFNADRGYDQIMVITDRLTKWAIFCPLKKSVTAREIAEKLLELVVLQYGVPRFLVTDRDVKFVNAIWEHFAQRLDMNLKLATSYNPQTDGQVEGLNKTIMEINKGYIKHHLATVVRGTY